MSALDLAWAIIKLSKGSPEMNLVFEVNGVELLLRDVVARREDNGKGDYNPGQIVIKL